MQLQHSFFRTLFCLTSAVALSILTSGCGKSKYQILAEMEQQKAKSELAAQAASKAELLNAENVQRQKQAQQLTALQTQVAGRLKDPLSAQFRETKLSSTGIAVCGQVNSKNSLGGYVGFQNFIATASELFLAPPGCGSTPVMQMSPTDGTACIEFLMAKVERHLCD